MIASASPQDYERTIRAVVESGEVDALIVIFIPPLTTPVAEVEAALRRAAAGLGRRVPILGVLMSDRRSGAGAAGVPVYTFPEDAVRALAQAAAWMEWRSRPEEPAWRAPDSRVDEARAIVASSLGRAGDGWLDPDAVAGLLRCYGIPLVEWRLASTPGEAARAAAELAVPVALKAYAPGLLHKTEAGAVALGLGDPGSVETAARAMTARLEDEGRRPDGFLVQPMAAGGAEMIVGVVQDPLFGPVVACGAGGTAVELLKDVRVRLAPLTESDADRMIHGLASLPLLQGYRGSPPADIPALRDVLLRVGALAEDLPEVVELDLNPVLAGPDGSRVLDARLRLEAREPPPPEGARPRSRRTG